MDTKHILLRYFLPGVVCFFLLSGISLVPAVQNIYYSTFEKLVYQIGSSGRPDLYFKTKKGAESTDDSDKVYLLFNSNVYLQSIIDRARATGTQGEYDYKAVIIPITEYFITPLIFLFSLLLVTPSSISRKAINFLVGSILLMGFAYLTVRFRVNYALVEESIPGIPASSPAEVANYAKMSHIFSPVATITFVMIVWGLLAFRKSDFEKFFPSKTLKMEN